MLFVITLIELFLVFFKSKNLRSIRKDLFSISIILSLFFFSSYDPFIGMPLYIYPMFLSVVISLLYRAKINRQQFFIVIVLLLALLVPLIRMELIRSPEKYLLLKESTTDLLSVDDQMYTPTVNFTVIKHFVFMLFYIFFVILNYDVVKDESYISSLLNKIVQIFKVLFVGLIIEWIIVNALGGINDRNLMGWIFSMKTINQAMNWKTWGSYSVALWLTERSNFNIVALFYMIYLKKRTIRFSEWIWIVLSAFACYCTGSSSCLAILAAYLVMEALIVIIHNKKISQYLFIGLACIGFTIVITQNFELFTNKLQFFLEGFRNIQSWNSGYFRANSIIYGINAVRSHVFFGVGIGTVLVHSMLIQTISNIGIIGTALTLWLHCKVCPIKMNVVNSVSMLYIIVLSCGCYMIQNFTSPFLITIFIILNCKEEILNAELHSKNYSLLLVRRKTSS